MQIRKFYPLIIPLLGVFLIRLALSFLPSFGFDMGTWFGWAGRLVDLGFSKFYSDTDWTQYTPGFMYWLWVIGKMGWHSELAIKIPVILADLGVGVLIWSLVRKVNLKLALITFFLYTLNPVTLFDGPVWGQIDGLLTLFLFLSAYFLVEKKNFIWSLVFWSIGFLVKPQAIAIAPAFLLVILLKKFKPKEILIGVFSSIALLLLASLPFFKGDPLLGLPKLVLKMTNYYAYTSVNGFNIWTWVGMWKPDTTLFFGISLYGWGIILLFLADLTILYVFRNKLNNRASCYLMFAMLSLSFFLFPTKVHERYLFPFFAFLLAAAGLSRSRKLFAIYLVSSGASFLNIYYPYSYYYPTQLRSDFLYNLSKSLAKIIGLLFLLSYFALLWREKLPKINLPKFARGKVEVPNLPKVKLSKNIQKYALVGILTFVFATRVFELGNPKKEYFDEVYHAFTAKVILHGDPQAWEWWNTPPEGFAYEWTHPPLAKLGMVLGMKVFGENSFGYRIPGTLLGVGVIYLIYLLAKTLFKDEATGLIAAGVFSLDGLGLVMSRIAMNDTYLLFFSLLSIYFFLKKKDLFSALAFGLALSSKWSAIWVVPILGILWLWRRKKFTLSIIWFFILPLAVYLLSYFPMFLTGHNLSVWWEMQKQMWWYHTGLKATHPYTSLWWSWPLLLRPIYLYTSDEIGGMVSRIYAMGNPLVFWFGSASVIMAFIYAFLEKNKKLAFVIFSYLIFFVPWAASPRIMFLYHYLPSLPFLAIATSYILRRNPKLLLGYSIIGLFVFIYFYPHWAGLNVPLWLDSSYYWVSSWR